MREEAPRARSPAPRVARASVGQHVCLQVTHSAADRRQCRVPSVTAPSGFWRRAATRRVPWVSEPLQGSDKGGDLAGLIYVGRGRLGRVRCGAWMEGRGWAGGHAGVV